MSKEYLEYQVQKLISLYVLDEDDVDVVMLEEHLKKYKEEFSKHAKQREYYKKIRKEKLYLGYNVSKDV